MGYELFRYFMACGAPEEIRTPDPQIRSLRDDKVERVLVSWRLEFVDVPSHHRRIQSLTRLRLQELLKIGDLDYDSTLARARL
jgi:hypothetical protein